MLPYDFCEPNIEYWPLDKSYNGTRDLTFNKDDAFHQFTIGIGGRILSSICVDETSKGKFYYINGINYGFALVHVTPSAFTFEYHGVTFPETPKPKSLLGQFWQHLGYASSDAESVSSEPEDSVFFTVKIVNMQNSTEEFVN